MSRSVLPRLPSAPGRNQNQVDMRTVSHSSFVVSFVLLLCLLGPEAVFDSTRWSHAGGQVKSMLQNACA